MRHPEKIKLYLNKEGQFECVSVRLQYSLNITLFDDIWHMEEAEA
jgi:uncharacterized protein YozE (UPF0346 family)